MKVSMEKLGANIRRAREAKGWSVEELADKAGATVNYVNKAEAGQRRITLYAAMSFCDALELTPNDLFVGIAEPD